MRPFFKDDDFNFLTEIALGATYHQAVDVGEVLSTVERIRKWPRAVPGSMSGRPPRTGWPPSAGANADAGRLHSAARQFHAGVDVLRAGDLLVRRDG